MDNGLPSFSKSILFPNEFIVIFANVFPGKRTEAGECLRGDVSCARIKSADSCHSCRVSLAAGRLDVPEIGNPRSTFS